MVVNRHLNNVLLIEQDEQVAEQIKYWLSDFCSITQVIHEEEILGVINSQLWDLVITDVKLSTLNDVEITKFAKLNDPSCSVLIITEHQKINFILDALMNHADGLQFKPLVKEDFLPLVLKLLEDAKQRRMKQHRVVLAIGAHPDDVEIGCGGTLARHRNNGDTINILTLSDGGVGGDPVVRKREALEAARIQGARIFFGELADTQISENSDTISVIEKVVKEVMPTHVYTHSLHDFHSDHRNTYYASIAACRQIANLYCYQAPSGSVDFKPNLFIEINEEEMEEKLKVINIYSSQCKIRSYLKDELIRATAVYWGRFCNYHLAEPLEVIRQKVIAERK